MKFFKALVERKLDAREVHSSIQFRGGIFGERKELDRSKKERYVDMVGLCRRVIRQ